MTTIGSSRSLAKSLLANQLPDRWLHVSAVAQNAERIHGPLNLNRRLLVAAAWLHDIGYSPAVGGSGFHSLDGARFLRSTGHDAEICCLVAHHSAAVTEAGLRGLNRELRREFAAPDRKLSDALWYCDMVAGPLGEGVTVEQRLHEIRERYGPDDVVTRFVNLAEHELLAAVRRTEERLKLAQLPS